ncbi:MAG TPA: hypothetical protein VJC39_01465 [Candidatus Nanoarchaeia archaeon]|nr:hypothetical protein [Candidatus Nanoarchaeia archaeon]
MVFHDSYRDYLLYASAEQMLWATLASYTTAFDRLYGDKRVVEYDLMVLHERSKEENVSKTRIEQNGARFIEGVNWLVKRSIIDFDLETTTLREARAIVDIAFHLHPDSPYCVGGEPFSFRTN